MEDKTIIDLDSVSQLIEIFSIFSKDKSYKISQSCKTIIGILKGIQQERLREKVLEV